MKHRQNKQAKVPKMRNNDSAYWRFWNSNIPSAIETVVGYLFVILLIAGGIWAAFQLFAESAGK